MTHDLLATLPQELIDKITSQLTHRSDLCSFSKTSKRIRAATVGALFENVIMVWRCIHHERRTNSKSQSFEFPALNLLLRTLLEVPGYAKYVTNVDLQATGYREDFGRLKPHLPSFDISASYVILLKATLQRIGLDQTEDYESLKIGIMNNDFNAVIALFLLLCSEVKTLTLGLDIIMRNPFLRTIFQYALPMEISMQISRFQRLQTLNLGTNLAANEDTTCFRVEWPKHVPDGILDLDAYLPLFYLPVLREAQLSLPGLPWDEEFLWPSPSSPIAPSLTSLRLPECSIMPEILHSVLSSTPNLILLEYECCLFYNDVFDAFSFTSALKLVKQTLAHLKMSLRFWSSETVQPGDEEHDWVPQTCSLKIMTALKTVSVPSCVLLGWKHGCAPELADVLPPNIISVQLQDDCGWYEGFAWKDKRLMPYLQAFLENGGWRESTPRLQDVSISYWRWKLKDIYHDLCNRNGLKGAVTAPKSEG